MGLGDRGGSSVVAKLTLQQRACCLQRRYILRLQLSTRGQRSPLIASCPLGLCVDYLSWIIHDCSPVSHAHTLCQKKTKRARLELAGTLRASEFSQQDYNTEPCSEHAQNWGTDSDCSLCSFPFLFESWLKVQLIGEFCGRTRYVCVVVRKLSGFFFFFSLQFTRKSICEDECLVE